MNEAEIRALLAGGLIDCEIELTSEGNKLSLRLTGNLFEGMNRVKRQQLVYGLLNEKITSGEIHAVSMICKTPAEHAEQGKQIG
ncbi:MAG: acid stress-induced BolA-like protein IbaG/YrbA [Candidatus Azotimanducaceae bacterium]|jgi:acid stress-induced BolA-like protein IbaG/YrbA